MKGVLHIKDWVDIHLGNKQFEFLSWLLVYRIIDGEYFEIGERVGVIGRRLSDGKLIKIITAIESFDRDCRHVYLVSHPRITYMFDVRVEINEISSRNRIKPLAEH